MYVSSNIMQKDDPVIMDGDYVIKTVVNKMYAFLGKKGKQYLVGKRNERTHPPNQI